MYDFLHSEDAKYDAFNHNSAIFTATLQYMSLFVIQSIPSREVSGNNRATPGVHSNSAQSKRVSPVFPWIKWQLRVSASACHLATKLPTAGRVKSLCQAHI